MKNKISHNHISTDSKRFQTVVLCSNVISNFKDIFVFGEVVPLAFEVGQDADQVFPLVSLYGIKAPNSLAFIQIVDKSVAKHPAVKVSRRNGAVEVTVSGKVIVAAEAISATQLVVKKLDLRPIGLEIYGDDTMMKIATNMFRKNRFDGTGVAFKLG